MTGDQKLDLAVARMLPDVMESLRHLVGIPSVAFSGFDPRPVRETGAAVVELLRDAGATDAQLIDVPGGFPCVYADLPGPEGSPTVLLYAHYDVQPAPVDQGWTSDPFVAVTGADGRLYGRGAADDKSGVVIHAATLQALGPDRPCRIRVLIEGEEETISHLEDFVASHPEMFRADAYVVADSGGQAVGRPGLTIALRGTVACTVTVRTLAHPAHSGLFGGAAPDAVTAMIRLLDTLHDDDGAVAVSGLAGCEWSGAPMDESSYRTGSGILPGVEMTGTGSLADRVWSMPALSVVGMDMPGVAQASNVLHAAVTAKLSLRIAPGVDAEAQWQALEKHLVAHAPWNCEIDVTRVRVSEPFRADPAHPVIIAATSALSEAYAAPVELLGSGASIPLVPALARLAPHAAIILWGAEDTAEARAHGADESVDPTEIARMIATQVTFLRSLTDLSRTGTT